MKSTARWQKAFERSQSVRARMDNYHEYILSQLALSENDLTKLAQKVTDIVQNALDAGRTHSVEDQLSYLRDALKEIIETCDALKPEQKE